MDLKDLTCSESRPGEGGCLLTPDRKEIAKPTLTVPRAGTLKFKSGTLKAKVPSRDMGLTTPAPKLYQNGCPPCLTMHICSQNVQAPVK